MSFSLLLLLLFRASAAAASLARPAARETRSNASRKLQAVEIPRWLEKTMESISPFSRLKKKEAAKGSRGRKLPDVNELLAKAQSLSPERKEEFFSQVDRIIESIPKSSLVRIHKSFKIQNPKTRKLFLDKILQEIKPMDLLMIGVGALLGGGKSYFDRKEYTRKLIMRTSEDTGAEGGKLAVLDDQINRISKMQLDVKRLASTFQAFKQGTVANLRDVLSKVNSLRT